MSPDTQAADRIIAANAHKPIRVMLPSDFYAPQLRKVAQAARGKASQKTARADLATRCEQLLQVHGALTTAQLSKAMGVSARAVASACRLIPRVSVDTFVARGGSRSLIWMVPRISAIGGQA